MRLKWKMALWTAMAALVLVGAGCGGISTTQSVSPASFLLPGLLQADPPPATPAAPGAIPTDPAPKEIARS